MLKSHQSANKEITPLVGATHIPSVIEDNDILWTKEEAHISIWLLSFLEKSSQSVFYVCYPNYDKESKKTNETSHWPFSFMFVNSVI